MANAMVLLLDATGCDNYHQFGSLLHCCVPRSVPLPAQPDASGRSAPARAANVNKPGASVFPAKGTALKQTFEAALLPRFSVY